MPEYIIASSIISADMARLGQDVEAVLAAGAGTFVAVSAVFGNNEYAWAIGNMRKELRNVT